MFNIVPLSWQSMNNYYQNSGTRNRRRPIKQSEMLDALSQNHLSLFVIQPAISQRLFNLNFGRIYTDPFQINEQLLLKIRARDIADALSNNLNCWTHLRRTILAYL